MTLDRIMKIKERNEKAYKRNEANYQTSGISRYSSASRRNDEAVYICSLALMNASLVSRAKAALESHNYEEQQSILKDMIKKYEHLV